VNTPRDDGEHQDEGDGGEEAAAEPPTRKGPAMVVFFSNMALCTMRMSHEINVDGTFATCPPPFKQIVFIQARQPGGKRAIPVVFALLTNKVI
jgi:hypothetical protein